VRYADLVEFRTVGPETQPLVEAAGGGLSVQVHLAEAPFDGEFHEAEHDCHTGPGAAVLRQHCDAPNLTGGFQASRANQVTFRAERLHKRERVWHDRVEVVPLVALVDALFFDENRAPHVLDRAGVTRPVGDLDDD
jgi:hypothetical protein